MARHLPLLAAAVLLLALAIPVQPVAVGEEVICYFSSWARWRPGDGMFDVEDIDPFLCSTVVFSFTGLSNVTWELEVLDPWNELCPEEEGGNYCAFDRFVALKKINPDLITLLAVGGWREGSVDYSEMVADPAKRKTFIDSAIARIQKHGFDGLDFDWEYPAARGGVPEDKDNFIIMLHEMKQRFDTFNPPLLLTAAVAAGKNTIDMAYDVTNLVPLLHRFHLMTYDYHGAFNNFTHHNAPLCGYYLDEGDMRYFNVRFSVEYYIQLGVPREMMIMGIPTYGRCWTLDDINNNGMLAPAHKPGPAGPYIRIPGTLGFNEICEKLIMAGDDCKVVNDPNLFEPYFYCYSDKIWCGFDDSNSVYTKSRFAKNEGLAGILVWQIDTDDFQPFCYEEPFHLIKEMKRGLMKPAGGDEIVCPDFLTTTTEPPTTTTTEPPSTTTEPPTTTTEPPTTTESPTTTTELPTPTTTYGPTTTRNPSVRPDCSGLMDGTTFPHSDCNKYWECISGTGILELCSPGTVWDDTLKICNWEDEVDTSNCYQWICSIDNTYYPHADCDKYYRCYNGSPHLEQCPNGLFWNQEVTQCVNPEEVDTSTCNIP